MEVESELITEFKKLISEDVAVPVCAMKSLTGVIKRSTSTTWMNLNEELRSAIEILKNPKYVGNTEALLGRTSISLNSGCELFMKYVTSSFMGQKDFNVCKNELIARGENFTGMSLNARDTIASLGHSFVQDNCTVLTHGFSRVVTTVLLKALECGKQFRVIVTEGRPSSDGHKAARLFKNAGIPTTLILESAMGAVMSNNVIGKVDLCLVGAEGVMETGAIVNKIGTNQMALVAKALQIPFYVAVESYKFSRNFPLTSRDIQDLIGSTTISSASEACVNGGEVDSEVCILDTPPVDFTPANLITLLFTDLGVLTPAAVSDELIRMMYQ